MYNVICICLYLNSRGLNKCQVDNYVLDLRKTLWNMILVQKLKILLESSVTGSIIISLVIRKDKRQFLGERSWDRKSTVVKFLPTCVLTAELSLLISLVPLGTFVSYKILHCWTQLFYYACEQFQYSGYYIPKSINLFAI